MATRITVSCLCVLGLVCTARTQAAERLPPPAYEWSARAKGIPANVLFAVALTESGTPLRGRLVPWPWTLNVAGIPSRYGNRDEACVAMMSALKSVPANVVDVGLEQINVGYNRHRFTYPCDLLDPYRNLDIAADILNEHYSHCHNWLVAIGRYRRPAGGITAARYREGVARHLSLLTEIPVRHQVAKDSR
jgi:soluble lytic murein transglycosylase-like protein